MRSSHHGGDLAASEAAADLMLAAHGKSFHWARRFLGPTAARQATLLYAFCRLLDDIADGDAPGGEMRLRAIEARLGGDTSVDAPEADAFLGFANSAGVPVSAAQDLIAGLLFDQGEVLLQTEADLIRYAYQVAGTVGLMMAPLLGRRDPRADAFAVDLGVAMQLTNIARDVLEDAHLNRRYLPAEWCDGVLPLTMREAALGDDDKTRHAVAKAVADTLRLADTYYASGLQGLTYLPLQNDVAIAIAASVYQAIGHRLRARQCAWWQGRQVVGIGGKIIRSLASLSGLSRRFQKPMVHDDHLHHALKGFDSVAALR